jgi:hypothetical protein
MSLFERSRTLTILHKIRKRINQKCHMRQRMMAYAFTTRRPARDDH